MIASAVYQPDLEQVQQMADFVTFAKPFNITIEELANDRTIGRWAVFSINEDKVRILAVRGSTTSADWLADLNMLATVGVLRGISNFMPVLSLLPPFIVRTLIAKFGSDDLFGAQDIFAPLMNVTETWQKISSIDGHQLIITGHSLGGLLSTVVGARLGVESISFSPTGDYYSSTRFQTENSKVKTSSVVIKPDYDVVPMIDIPSGFTQGIQCLDTWFIGCHSIDKSVCEIYSRCGDWRQRSLDCKDGKPIRD